jgi:uncharacterized membrane-anchored protein YitT (DUF2179 family)
LKKANKKRVRYVKDMLLTLMGMFSAALGLKGFLLPNHFIDGGVMGISILTSISTNTSLALLVIVFNLPFIGLGYSQIGRQFAIKSTIAILGLSAILALVTFPEITDDKLLTAIFGGIFLGAGIGLCMRGGCVLDGTEVAAIILSPRTSISIGDLILIFNIIIFSVGALVLGMEIAMYSVLTYFSASKMIDFIIHGIEEYIGVFIVSSRHEAIRKVILKDMGRGVTVLKGQRGLSSEDQDVLFCVFTRLEMPKVRAMVKLIDENAFVVMHRIDDTTGGLVKKRPFH